jgi:hypothetical protein
LTSRNGVAPAPDRDGDDVYPLTRAGKGDGSKMPGVIVGQASATVAASPADVFAFVLDLERYRQADRKIGAVGPMTRAGDSGTVTFSGRIKGIPEPAGTYPFTMTESRLVIGSAIAGPARWFLDFEGTFDCEVTAVGTLVTHREVFNFKGPWRRLVEPLLRHWLETDTVSEMVRFKRLVDSGAGRPPTEG